MYYNPYEAHFKAPVFNASTGFIGNGANITNINASNISSGTLEPDRLKDSGVTSGSYGPSDNGLGSDSHTLKVPYITVDSKGRISNATTQTISLPLDKMVQQYPDNSSNKEYRLLFSNADTNYSETAISRKSDNLTYNPSTNNLTVGNITTTGAITSNGTITSKGLQCNGDLSASSISASQIEATGKISGSTISGSGAGITNLNASNIKLGTLSKDIIIEGNAATATKATTATSLETVRNINGISFDGSSNVINYGTCSSSESATEKVVACSGFTLINGAMITVYFSKSNTVAQPTLNVNSTGAKNIINKGFSNVFKNYFKSGYTYTFIYISGTYHVISGEDFNTNNLVVAGSSTATTTTTSSLTNAQVYLNMIEDNKVKSSFQIVGEGKTSVTADSTGNISIKTSIDSLPNPNALTIQGNGTTITTYDGSFAKTVNITPSSIGAAASSHTHSEYKSDIAINRTTLGMQCKNMLNNTAVSKTISGITFTVNSDKSVTVNGTATAMAQLTVGTIVKDGNYILTGCPSGGSTSTYMLSLAYHNVSGNTTYGDETGSGRSVVFDSEKYSKINVRIQINKGATVSNLTFYPMLRDADITDNTYEPYQPSLIDRCFLKDNANITLYEGALGSSSGSITIENLSNYSLLWVYIDGIGATAGNFATSVEIPVAYLAKGNSLNLAGGIPSVMEVTESGVGAILKVAGYITASVSSTNVLNLSISSGTIGNVKIVSIM